jgi:hypothetical protein
MGVSRLGSGFASFVASRDPRLEGVMAAKVRKSSSIF